MGELRALSEMGFLLGQAVVSMDQALEFMGCQVGNVRLHGECKIEDDSGEAWREVLPDSFTGTVIE